jgi:hypothetical protein
MSGNGGTVVGPAVQLIPNQPLSWVYRTSNTSWYPVYGGAGRATALVSGTAVASTSGTSIDFTGIPSWVKRITVMFSNVSTNGNSAFLIQIGSGSITSTGYLSVSSYTGSGTGSTALTTTGFVMMHGAAAEAHSGTYSIYLLSGNTYVGSGAHGWTAGGTYAAVSGGNSSALSGALDRVRITTVLGTDTFDLGSINILYE